MKTKYHESQVEKMYVIEIDGRYLTGFMLGLPQLDSSKFGALKFNSEFEASSFLSQQGYFGSSAVVPAY